MKKKDLGLVDYWRRLQRAKANLRFVDPGEHVPGSFNYYGQRVAYNFDASPVFGSKAWRKLNRKELK